MVKKARVSIIIAAYNAERYIAETLESVLAQTYPDVECIVVDDGSTDRTGEIVRAYEDRVRYVWQENAERSVARNRGIDEATGEYVAFLDADDLIMPEKIVEQAAFLDSHPEYDVVYSRVRYVRDGVGTGFEIRRPAPSGDILGSLVYRNFINLASPLVRSPAVARVGGFDAARPEIILNEDWDFWLRLALAGSRFAFLDTIHVSYRLHAANTSADRLRSYASKLRVAQKIVDEYGDALRESGIDAAPVLAFHRADYGRGLINHGRLEEGRLEIAASSAIPFPYRRSFQVYAFAAGLLGHRLLAALQRLWRGEL